MHEKSIYWIALLALGLLVAPATTQGQVVNLVKNPSFEEDEVILNDPAYDQWWTWGYDTGVNGTVKFDQSERIDGARSLRVDPQGSTNWYFIVAYSPIPQKVGTKYTASLWAKGQAPRPLAAQMKATDNSVSWGYTDFQITTDWAEYKFTSASQNATTKLEIYCAASEVPLWLDFVYVYEGEYVPGIKPSGASSPAKAGQPAPADKAVDVPYDSVLGWTGSKFAATHDVYLGKTLADVNNAGRTKPAGVLASQGQTATAYTPAALLDFGQTYYWRVDEVNKAPDNTIFKGDVWSFTVEPYAYPITGVTATASSSAAGMGPEKTIDGSGLDKNDLHGTDGTTMWLSGSVQPNWIQYQFDKVYKLNDLKVWNSNQMIETFLGFGAKNVAIQYSTDGTTWTALANVPEFAKAPGMAGYAANTTVSFGGVMAKYVKLTINSNWGGMASQTGLSEVRFSYVPVQARVPQPAAGATGVSISTTMNWRPGREATSHKVYLGTDPNAVANGTAPAKTVTAHSFDTGSLTYGTTYYWKVDEVGAAATYPGQVWSFTTQEFAVVDDFESYNDTDNRIYDTWIDGWTNGTGSTVGYLQAPFAERTIVHGGKQSMPMDYNNIKTPFYSEVARDFSPAQDWTLNGATNVSVWFRGYPVSFVDKGNNAFTISGGGTDIWNNADDFRFAYKKLTGNGSITARVDSIVNTNGWAKAGVMIRETLNAGSMHADVVVSVANSCSLQYRQGTDGASASTNWTGTAVTAPYWVRLTRTGSAFKAESSPDGKTWTQLGTDTTIVMGSSVYIGLPVTSHDATLVTTAEISNVSTTGNVTGTWQVAAIGTDPEPGNSPEKLYIVVQDSAGKSKVVTHPDPAATTAASWQQWRIPLSDFTSAGVKMTSVKKLYIGVGDRSSPKAAGAGMLYIDDIGFGRSLP
jgi:regulation of enolase protein 1 (concanavalin A-like superfamily)